MPSHRSDRAHRDQDHSHRDKREREKLTREESGSQEILDEGIIQVQVIPQDDNWGETATSITETATSIVTLSETSLSDVGKESRRMPCNFGRHFKLVPAAILSIFAVATPILFVVFPLVTWKPSLCGSKCDGLFISFTVKELLLMIAIWALYFRTSRASMPRVFVLRVAMMVLVFVVLVCYWLFYGLRIIEAQVTDFMDIINFSVTLIDTLLFLHYASLVVLWIRQTDPLFTLKVIRSTDGVSRYYNIGPLSIQRTAVFVLEQYYKDFPEYNPYMMQTPARTAHKQFSSLTFYDIDGKPSDKVNPRAKAILTAASTRRRDPARNDRFYEEAEFDRKVKRRKARLFNACEEAFGHIKRVQLERGPCVPMDPEETAQSLFPSFARPLQKYLRTVRLHHRYSMDGIIKHLAHCLTFDMTPKAFLERYVSEQPCCEFTTKRRTQNWSLVCEEQVTKPLSASTVFQLKGEDLSIIVTVRRLPYLDISEDEFDFENNKFVLRLNSETSV